MGRRMGTKCIRRENCVTSMTFRGLRLRQSWLRAPMGALLGRSA